MLIYLDAKDLINIIEKSLPCSADQFRKILQQGKHKLVLSMITIMELSEPLLHKEAKSNVMGLLNRLERLPHVFIHSSSIPSLELKQAIKVFSIDEEYSNISPFVNRFDETVDLNAAPSTKIYLNYPLAETVWDLYSFGAVGGLDKYGEKLRQVFVSERALSPKPTLKENFAKTIERTLNRDRISYTPSDITSLANWIYSNPLRCPSVRLGYEIWHKMVKNVTDKPNDSDLEDFHHIECLPYVDVMTVDRRMHGYISQVSASIGISYESKSFRNSEEILDKIDKNKFAI